MKIIIAGCLVAITFATPAFSSFSDSGEDFFNLSLSLSATSSSSYESRSSTSLERTPRSCSYTEWKEQWDTKRQRNNSPERTSSTSPLIEARLAHYDLIEEFNNNRESLRESAEKLLAKEILAQDDELFFQEAEYWAQVIDRTVAERTYQSRVKSEGLNFESYQPPQGLIELIIAAKDREAILSAHLAGNPTRTSIEAACLNAQNDLDNLVKHPYVANMQNLIYDTQHTDPARTEEELLLIKIEACISDTKIALNHARSEFIEE